MFTRGSLMAPCVAIAVLGGSAFAQGVAVTERIKQCAACHGEDGNSTVKAIPSLAGQPEFFVLNQLFLMREGVRRIAVMAPYVNDLTDADIDALAKHFTRLAPRASDEPIDPALVTRGRDLAVTLRCASCHLPSFAGRQQMPRLAGQRIDYLIHSMKEFRDNTRSGADTIMSSVVGGLPDVDVTALAHYAASLESSK